MLSLDDANASDDKIADYLEEIEGDNHTFLHFDNLIELKKLGFVNDEIINLITQLRQILGDLPKGLWNIKSFRESEQWIQIHKSAKAILVRLDSIS
jgi:hypothetical protein